MAPPTTPAGRSACAPAVASAGVTCSPSPVASSSRLSPPRATSTTPSRGRLNRSWSTKSDLSTSGDVRQWTPTRAIALTSIEGREGRGKVTAKEALGDAERGLSSLYVENERIVGSRESPPKRNRKTWGGTLVSGAMNAGVFGAALGLTAYRIWHGEERHESTSSPASVASTLSCRDTVSHTSCSSASTSAGPSSVRSRPDSVELPPPPTYSESSHHELVSSSSTVKEDEAWEDLNHYGAKRSPATGSHSRTPSKTSPRQHRHRQRMSRGRVHKVSTRSVASITVEDVLSPSSEQPPPSASATECVGQNAQVEGEEQGDDSEEGPDPYEVLRRLDAMGETLQMMIADAKKALALPSPVVVETEGWEDQLPVSDRKARRRTLRAEGSL